MLRRLLPTFAALLILSAACGGRSAGEGDAGTSTSTSGAGTETGTTGTGETTGASETSTGGTAGDCYGSLEECPPGCGVLSGRALRNEGPEAPCWEIPEAVHCIDTPEDCMAPPRTICDPDGKMFEAVVTCPLPDGWAACDAPPIRIDDCP